MARDKRGKGRQESSPELESQPSSDSEATHDVSPPPVLKKRKAVAKVPLRAKGRRKPLTQGGSGQGSRPRMKRASGNHGDDGGDSLAYLEHMILCTQKPTRRTPPSYNGHRTVNYMKGKHNFYTLRYEDPSEYPKEMQGNVRFWTWFQADWYETVILTKTHIS